jgi:hypothetical protein
MIKAMNERKKILTELIRIMQPIADLGHIRARQVVINASIELEDLDRAEKNQTELNLTISEK